MKKRNNKLLASYGAAYDEFPGKEKVTLKEFKYIINAFTLNLLSAILQTGISYKMPYGLGILGVKKISKYVEPVNWVESRKQEKIVNRRLLFTGGLLPKMFWVKKRDWGARFLFTDIWRMKWSRLAKKAMFHEAIENNNIIKYY